MENEKMDTKIDNENEKSNDDISDQPSSSHTQNPRESEDELMRTDSENTKVDKSDAKLQKEDKNLFRDEMKFMKDFDPNERLFKKKMKRFTESGIVIGKCDCRIPTCPGCHFFPCKSCGSHYCGHECRLERHWNYDELEIQGPSGSYSKRP